MIYKISMKLFLFLLDYFIGSILFVILFDNVDIYNLFFENNPYINLFIMFIPFKIVFDIYFGGSNEDNIFKEVE